MRLLLPATIFVAALAAPSAFGQAKPKLPVSTIQAQPINRILAGVRQVAGRFGGPDAAGALDDQITEKLGPKGLTGLNLDRPITAYQILKDDLDKPAFVVLVPITDKADALDLLKRLKVDAEADAKDADLYELTVEGGPEATLKLRFKGNVAYVGINVDNADLDPKALPTAASLTLPNEGSWLAMTSYFDRVPPEFVKKIEGSLDQAAGQFGGLPVPQEFRDRMVAFMKVSKKYTAIQYEQGKTVSQRLNFDPKTLQFSIDYKLTPKASTQLAADIAARKPTDNRYTAVVGQDAVAGFVTKFPLFLPELRDGTADLLKLAEEKGLESVPEEYKPAAEEAIKGFARAAKTGRIDIAGSISGPSKDGTYSAAGAISFGDATKLDAELRKLRAGMEANVRGLIKLDVYKAEGVAVHEINAAVALTASQRKIWGDEATVCVAFTKTGLLATFGTDSLARIKELIKSAETPKPAEVLDFKVNFKRTRDFAALVGHNPLGEAIPATAKDDLRSLVKLSVAGGDDLAVRFLVDLGVVEWLNKAGADGN